MAALVVMAAGMGTRYGGLKQIDAMGPSGETLLEYSVFDAIQAGFEKLVFVIKPEFEDVFRQDISAKFMDAAEVIHVFQVLDVGLEGFVLPNDREKPWGTGHALLSAANAVSSPFAVINADDFYGRSSFRAIADYLNPGSGPAPDEAALVGYALKNTLSTHGHVARGVCEVDQDLYVRRITEHTKIFHTDSGVFFVDEQGEQHSLRGDEIVSMNLWGFHPSFFAHLETGFSQFLRDCGDDPKAEFFIPTVVNQLLGTGAFRAKVLPTDDVWFGVTYREDKPATRSHLQRLTVAGEYPEALWP